MFRWIKPMMVEMVNADYGIDSIPKEPKHRKWYRWHKFPLLPNVEYKARNEWNSTHISFSWLFLRVWTMDSPDIGLHFDLQDSGMSVRLRLPYLNIHFWLLPFPDSFARLSMDRLWRRGTRKL